MPDNKVPNVNELGEVHIYKDDATGDMYIFDGTQLVKIGNSTPQIGDKGDREFQDKEEEERKAQIEKERAEAEENGEEVDEEETEEEKQQRIDDIKNMMGDEGIADDIQNETRGHVDKELKKKRAAKEKEVKKYTSSMQRFRESLRRFIANQVSEIRDRTFKREDPSYEGSGIIRPGRMIDDNNKIPKINVYFDQSSSWGDADIRKGEEAIGVLNNYVKRGEITIDVYYFSDFVSDNKEQVAGGGTAAGAELIEHIQATKPDNVIVMTDADFDHWGEINEAPNIKVPGAVWLLFRKGERSILLQQHLKGRKQTRVFDF